MKTPIYLLVAVIRFTASCGDSNNKVLVEGTDPAWNLRGPAGSAFPGIPQGESKFEWFVENYVETENGWIGKQFCVPGPAGKKITVRASGEYYGTGFCGNGGGDDAGCHGAVQPIADAQGNKCIIPQVSEVFSIQGNSEDTFALPDDWTEDACTE